MGEAANGRVLVVAGEGERSLARVASALSTSATGAELHAVLPGQAVARAARDSWALVVVDALEASSCPPLAGLRAATAAPLVVLASEGAEWVEVALLQGADEVCGVENLLRASRHAQARRGAAETATRVHDAKNEQSRQRRLQKHHDLLRALAKELSSRDLSAQLQAITEAAARSMDIARVGVWLFDTEHRRIRAENVYDARTDEHSEGIELTSEACPGYFAALEEERVIAAHDAASHAATRCFASGYLAEHGISSMLDAPIRVGGKVLGVLCHEHVGPKRIFTDEDQSAAGNLADFVALAIESRERSRAEDALLSSNRQLEEARRIEAVGRLAGGVAHDFNNVITVVSSYAFLLAKRLDKNDALQGPLAEIGKAAERAADITRKLLALTRREPLTARVFDLNTVVRGTEMFLRRLIGEHIVLTLELHPEPLMLRADPGQIEQVLLNLVINARDATMPEGGCIKVRTRRSTALKHGRDMPCLLEVEDQGVGMAPEVKARIFEPFFTTKDVGRGSGLGLFTVWGAVDQMGALIDVVSEPNRGSRFTVYFAEAPADADPSASAVPEQQVLRGTEKILLVEDEPQVREVTTMILRDLGYEVLAASNIDDAIAHAKREKAFDLLVSDMVMPRASGPVVAAKLSELLPGLRVLFITGYSKEMLAAYDASLGPTLPKPFTAEQLGRKVREVLER